MFLFLKLCITVVYLVVKLGETCEEDVQCSKRTVGAICSGLHCVCSDLYTEEGGQCIPKKSKYKLLKAFYILNRDLTIKITNIS